MLLAAACDPRKYVTSRNDRGRARLIPEASSRSVRTPFATRFLSFLITKVSQLSASEPRQLEGDKKVASQLLLLWSCHGEGAWRWYAGHGGRDLG